MAIYAVQGLCAAGCLFTTYALCRKGLNLSFFSNPQEDLPAGIKDIVDSQVKRMGLEKEVMIIPDPNTYRCSAYGNTWFGKVSMKVGSKVKGDTVGFNEFKTAHQIAHVKANDFLIVPGATLAASLFTTFVLTVNCNLFTRYLGGLAVALITGAVVRRRAERRADHEAMKQCSKEVNQAYLNRLLEKKKGRLQP